MLSIGSREKSPPWALGRKLGSKSTIDSANSTNFNCAVFDRIGQNTLSQQAILRLHLENKEKFGAMIMEELTAAGIAGLAPTAWTPIRLQFVYLLSSGEHTKHQIPS